MALGFAADWLVVQGCFYDNGRVTSVNPVLAAVSVLSDAALEVQS